ncbi:MAG: RagB/SusD family nutrient uptake outer membrane protein [Paludibacteraceae bacterium]|nr:RagB/SusD family nutrient uptake outer membrane protein [Paludibacteraceae bacterium]
MNKIISTFKILLLSGLMLSVTSCEDFMSTESNRYMSENDNLLNSPNDSVFSLIGILAQMHKIADKYVLIGELRGDLLEVTENTPIDLRNLSNHNIDVNSSEFADTRDFYAVINNCNYFINRADTNISVRGDKPFVRELMAVKTIRAWTYLQLSLNYGQVRYFTKPVLSVDDLESNYVEMNTEQLVDTLINDLMSMNPLTNRQSPDYAEGTINPYFLLGDLYLWKAGYSKMQSDFENAAFFYSKLIDLGITIQPYIYVRWLNDRYENRVDSWSSIFEPSMSNELISGIQLAETNHSGVANQPLTVSKLYEMSRSEQLTISKAYQDISDAQIYCFREGGGPIKYTTGDLRIKATMKERISVENNTIITSNSINKYEYHLTSIYRRGLLYLRYAEAVNRAGKPSLAFTALKYGLNNTNLSTATRVNPYEIADQKPYVTIFNKEIFSENVGIHNRGAGNTEVNTSYVLPDFTRFETLKDINGNDSIVITSDPLKMAEAKADSILFVENAICDELALETALEGNRFQDLMRFSMHQNDPTFLAKKVAAKHSDNYNYYLNLLSEPQKWYLPMR